MKALNFRANFGYILGAGLSILFLIIRFIAPFLFENFLIFLIFSLLFLLFPGFLIVKLLKQEIRSFILLVILSFVFSLAFYFVLSFVTFLLKLDLNFFSSLILFGWLLLLVANFLVDYLRPSKIISIQLKEIFTIENIYFLIPAVLILIIFLVLLGKSPEINGDPYFHLSIIRKAFEGDQFNPRSLFISQLGDLNPSYVLPLWHTLIAFLARVFSLDILVLWQNLTTVLSLIVFAVWSSLMGLIFKNKPYVALGLSLFLIFYFYAGSGYLLARVLIPDTLAQLILLPLAIIFFLKYILENNMKWLLSLIGLVLLLVHATHYFYFLLFIILYLIFYSILFFREKEFKLTLKKISYSLIMMILPLIFVGLFLELGFKALSSALESFSSHTSLPLAYVHFSQFGLVYKYGYFLLLPAFLLFGRNKRYLTIWSLLFFVPIVYFTPLKDSFSQYLSYIFTDRLLANVAWYFLIFNLALGALLIAIDRLINHLHQKQIDILEIVLFALIMVTATGEFLTGFLSKFFYQILYDKVTFSFINQHLVAIWLGIVIISIVIVYIILKKKFLLNLETFKNHFIIFLLMAFLTFGLFSPSFEYLPLSTISKFLNRNQLTAKDYFLPILNNDLEGLKFIQEEIPAKSVIMADPEASKAIAVLTNQYLAYSPGLSWEQNLMTIYDQATSFELIRTLVLSPKYGIEYILVRSPENTQIFANHPEIFKPEYNGEIIIYQVM